MSMAHRITVEDQPLDKLPKTVWTQFEDIDNMPGPLRQCVHEFGYAIVKDFYLHGVREPRHIRQLVWSAWNGARAPYQRGGLRRDYSPMVDSLDWVLSQNPAPSAAMLLRILWINGLVIVPREPNHPMIDASMATVSNHDVKCTKEEKHRLRLRAAIHGAAKRLWPHLFAEESHGAQKRRNLARRQVA